MTPDTTSPLAPCDLIMKGGITSGVVYPRMIAKLSKQYTLKSIGGSSAGAIAAGGAAAAEYGRSHGAPGAFDELAKLPSELEQPPKGLSHSTLFYLFQPAPSLRSHYSVLASALNIKSKLLRLASILGALLINSPVSSLATLGAGGLVVYSIVAGAQHTTPAGIIAIGVVVIAAFLAALILASIVFFVSLCKGLSRNNFGLCSGMPSDRNASGPPALTPWMNDLFNGLAGPSIKGRPLTFGDLWGCGPDEESRNAAAVNTTLRAVDLQVMTTAISQLRPYSLPFRLEQYRLFLFDETEWEALFPKQVFDWIKRSATTSSALHPETKKPLWHLPHPADFPVVVAARMSLSFPILLSAIPLYAVDRSLKENSGNSTNPVATRVWFSDGGIGSNLPLHFFDAKLPSHPTFAVNLKPFHPNYLPRDGDKPGFENGRVYMPTPTPTTKPGSDVNRKGLARYWTATPPNSGVAGVVGFLASIVNTMHNWHDELFFPVPGYRDRIVQISQKDTEGGLNLDMPKDDIEALSAAGENAADEIIGRFVAPQPDNAPNGWTNHRGVRLRTLLSLLEQMTLEIAAHDTPPNGWRNLLRNLPCYPFPDPQANHEALADELLDSIKAMAGKMSAVNPPVSLENGSPRPEPELRVVPRI